MVIRKKPVGYDGMTLRMSWLRIDKLHIVYAVNQSTYFIRILTVRKRPPYNYDDLEQLLQQLL